MTIVKSSEIDKATAKPIENGSVATVCVSIMNDYHHVDSISESRWSRPRLFCYEILVFQTRLLYTLHFAPKPSIFLGTLRMIFYHGVNAKHVTTLLSGGTKAGRQALTKGEKHLLLDAFNHLWEMREFVWKVTAESFKSTSSIVTFLK